MEFVDDFTTVDRSLLEAYGDHDACPLRAAFIRDGVTTSAGTAAAVGTEVHRVLSEATRFYIESPDLLRASDLRAFLLNEAMQARPDVFTETMDVVSRMAWGWSQLIAGHAPTNILRFDGGTGSRTGQIAKEYPTTKTRVTSEVDLLLATPSPEVVEEIDYKSGWKTWDLQTIESSFQFTLHAVLLFDAFPDVRSVLIRVFAPRVGGLTRGVEFKRERLDQYDARVQNAVGEWYRHHKRPVAETPAYPTREKCRICDAASCCTFADGDLQIGAASPQTLLQSYIAASATAEACKKQLWAIVDRTGQDVDIPGVGSFGWGAKKKPSKPGNPLY